jgi:hypothetical protein
VSIGPTTIEGKSRSSKNAVRHGLAATRTVVLRNENPETWKRVLAAHVDRYNPADAIEEELVEDIAFCRWRLRRFRGVDTALWDLQMDDLAGQFAARYEAADETVRLACAFRGDNSLQLASRYEGRLRRSYERAIRNLKHYRSEAGTLEKARNEPS